MDGKVPSSASLPDPKTWSRVARRCVLHAISLAASALTLAWSRAASSQPARVRKRAESSRLQTEVALLRQELDIKDVRWARAPAHRRPHYGPVQRMQILELRALRGWSTEQTAERFLVTEETIASWMRRLDEEGETGLVRSEEPVNKFPDLVAYLVRRLKVTCPTLGKAKIAQVLARSGLHLGVSTVGRMLKRDLSKEDVGAELPVEGARPVRSKAPNDVWHVDPTAVPTALGFWVPWFPFARLLRWPFAWWVAVAVDNASRLAVGLAVYKRRPRSVEVGKFLDRAIERVKHAPGSIITDQGKEFGTPFRRWCRLRGIRHRLGKVGEHGSLAIVERFIRSMKSECTRRILVPFRIAAMRNEFGCYAAWFNEHRPHESLRGRTPLEVYSGVPPANQAPRFEPRDDWPPRAKCAAPKVPVRGKAGVRLAMNVSRLESRAHLPIVALRRTG